MALLIIPLVLGVFAVIAYVVYQQWKIRQEEMARLAEELGWQFTADADYGHDDRYAQFEIFRRGHSRCAYNTICGALAIDGRQWPVQMGDYFYQITSGAGKNRRTRSYRFSYVIVELPYIGLANLMIRPEGMFDRLAGFMGFDDIDFESVEFSDRFHVKSSDKKFAYDVCHPRMMEFLLQPDTPTIDLENQNCCLCDGRKCWKPEEFRWQLAFAQEFFALWPKHVTAMLEGDQQKYGP